MMHVKVIGISGSMGSGKEVVKQIILRNLSAYSVSLSAAIHGEMEKKRMQFTRQTMQDMGDEIRGKYGAFIFAKFSTEFMSRDRPYLVVEGITNPAEAEWLKKAYKGDFVLVGVDAQQQTRFDRLKKKENNHVIEPASFDEFVRLDSREMGEGEPAHGLQVRKCIEMADYKITNDGDQAQLESAVKEMLSKISAV